MTKRVDATQLLADAQAVTGLQDWGDPTLPMRFALAVEKINGSAMPAHGMDIAERHIRRFLTTRLQFFEDRNLYPIDDEIIDRPMLVTGEPRSGTTLMHALMSVDPRSRALRFREVTYPSPPPGLSLQSEAQRKLVDDEWRAVNETQHAYLISHPYNDMLGDGLPECERTWSFDFRVMTPDAWLQMPMNAVTDLPGDSRAQYRIHKMMLQQLQYRRPPKRWVLKGWHGWCLRDLFEAYPDAQVAWLHRDPVQAAASFAKMMHDIYDGILAVDIAQEAKVIIERMRVTVAKTLTDPLMNDPRVFHLRYLDFVSDPVASIRAYYDHFGRELTSEAEARMTAYLLDNPADRYGKFRYSTDSLVTAGENVQALHDEFEHYRDRFGVLREGC